MAECNAHKTTTYTLILEHEEAMFLKDLLQNPLPSEDFKSHQHRSEIFRVIYEAEVD